MSFPILKKKESNNRKLYPATEQWHKDRNLIEGLTDKDPSVKTNARTWRVDDPFVKGRILEMILAIC